MTKSFPQKSLQAKALKRGLALGRAIARMSDAANSGKASEARPSTEAMVRAAVELGRSFPRKSAEHRELATLAAAGREMLAALGVDDARLTAAGAQVVESFRRVMPLLGGA
ncbi:MAG: hypothetical protein ACHQ0J_10515 [Candidatus Dormibacterales bacterium]